MRALIFALLLPTPTLAEDNRCVTQGDQTICDCATLTADMRICGSWQAAWVNLPAPEGTLALLQSLKGITTIVGTSDALIDPETIKADYLASFPELIDVRSLPDFSVKGYDGISFTGTSTRTVNRQSPIAVSILASDADLLIFETVFPNAFGLPENATLSSEMQQTHQSLFDQLEMTQQ